MAKRFRLSCPKKAYFENPDKTKRPPKPRWLSDDCKAHATRNQRRSWEYWNQIYWATPPWITPIMVSQMEKIYRSAPGSHEVDHVVPLKSDIVCGLHVPWNLESMPSKRNKAKSNYMWPGHPNENKELFELDFDPYQMRLL